MAGLRLAAERRTRRAHRTYWEWRQRKNRGFHRLPDGRGRWRGCGTCQGRVVPLGEQRQVVEIDSSVVVEVALGEGLPRAVVVLRQRREVVEIDGAVVVGVAGQVEEVERVEVAG